jgi:hypothetical protein
MALLPIDRRSFEKQLDPAHGNRILFLDETEQNAFQDIGGEAGAVAFAAQTIF